MYDDYNSVDIYQISNYSKYDGPGTRVVVFFQTCISNCTWCHSPHSIAKSSPLLYSDNLCIGCKRCVDVCLNEVHSFDDGNHILNRDKCEQCGKCISSCPVSSMNKNTSALILPTKKYKTLELYNYIYPDLYMLRSKGGITLSGGEALLQAEAAIEILCLCRLDGISTAVETSGLLDEKRYNLFSKIVDTWLFGLRLTSDTLGIYDYDKINRSLKKINSFSSEVIIRYPVIPTVTDCIKHLELSYKILINNNIDRIFLSKFNRDTDHYYKMSGIEFKMTMPTIEKQDESYEFVRNFFESKNILCDDICKY